MMTGVSFKLGITAIIIVGVMLYHIVPTQSRLHQKNQKKAKQLLQKINQGAFNAAYIFGMLRNTNCFVFEELLLLCFKKKGYRISRNKAYTGDGGIDGTIYNRQGHRFLIQAKRYQSAINPKHVKEFAAVIHHNGAVGGFFIHTGRTGPKSYQSLTPRVRIISGEKLLNLLITKKR